MCTVLVHPHSIAALKERLETGSLFIDYSKLHAFRGAWKQLAQPLLYSYK